MAVRRRSRSRPRYYEGKSDEEWDDIFAEVDPDETPDIRGDKWNIATLLGLYLLQGIPLGLSSAIPIYMQNVGVTYAEQAKFSFVQWPFSLKLLWAPIVDSLYSTKMGKRKSWLVPSQYLIGIFMLFLSYNVDSWLENGDSSPDITRLTFYFFSLNFLAATQDIVVDGWALTMLQRRNVAHASTCNSVGQTAGYFLGYILFMALDSSYFCNEFIRKTPQPEGLVSLSGFLYFWGIVFIFTTTLIFFFKREMPPQPGHDVEHRMKFVKAYKQLWQIIKLPAMRRFIVILLTSKIAFAACDGVSSLKLLDNGVTKDKLAGLAVLAMPLQIVLPLIISKFLVGSKPMNIYIQAIPYRMLLTFGAVLVVWLAPYSEAENSSAHIYYVFLMVVYLLIQIPMNIMYVATMAFFARISDPAVGGTYMTLLNTVSNLGGNWPATVALWLVDMLTLKECPGGFRLFCNSKKGIHFCDPDEEYCEIVIDGYYVESVFCFLVGCLWLHYAREKVLSLQCRSLREWQVVRDEDS